MFCDKYVIISDCLLYFRIVFSLLDDSNDDKKDY